MDIGARRVLVDQDDISEDLMPTHLEVYTALPSILQNFQVYYSCSRAKPAHIVFISNALRWDITQGDGAAAAAAAAARARQGGRHQSLHGGD